MTRLRLAFLALALSLAGAGAAQAAIAFSRSDQNHDNVVTFEEMLNVLPRLKAVDFRKFDSDGNGVLSYTEYAGFDAFLDIMYFDR